MRAIAVIMMIQGHTVDTFLAQEYRTMDSVIYSIWYTLRGFTAPIFMFTAGLVFTYLLKFDQFEFLKNPRVKKGFKRALLLIAIGYLLRYPTYKIFDFTYVRAAQWDIFFAVDALHLIGVGMLLIMFCVLFALRAHLSLNSILYIFIVSIIIFSPVITRIDWINIFPQYIASYFTNKYGSLFPIFPWVIYVLSGALLGNYLYKNEGIFLKKRFSFSLLSIGSVLIVLSFILFYLQETVEGKLTYWFYSNGIVFLRVGGVFLLNALVAFVVRRIDKVPFLVKETGRRTLLLYVVHIVILYGCAWFPGLYRYYAKTFTPIETIVAVILMMGAMLSLAQFSRYIKIYTKKKLALIKV